jgi:hypothetical protein
VNNLRFVVMVGDPPLVVFEPVDVVLATPRIDTTMKKLGIRIPLLGVSKPSTLLFSRPCKNSQTHDPPFEPLPEVTFILG